MPRYSIEIRGRDWTIESRKFNTQEEAEQWVQEEFVMINGEYTIELIDWSNQSNNNSVALA